MPIPGSILNGLNFDPANLGAIAYPSLATFLQVNKSQDASGQEIHTFTTIDAAHTDIPCRRSPLILIRPQIQEKQSGSFQMSEAKLQVNLSRYVSDASLEWRLTVDGVTYEIVAVEPDGSNLTTRIGIGKIVPFNA
jgi:head-tail adaptor